MLIQLQVALTHLTGRRRQTLVSLTGVVLGVAFFLACSSIASASMFFRMPLAPANMPVTHPSS